MNIGNTAQSLEYLKPMINNPSIVCEWPSCAVEVWRAKKGLPFVADARKENESSSHKQLTIWSLRKEKRSLRAPATPGDNVGCRWEGARLPRSSGNSLEFPEFHRKFPGDFPELLSLWVLRVIQRFPGSSPRLPQKFPRSPQRSTPLSGKPDTL